MINLDLTAGPEPLEPGDSPPKLREYAFANRTGACKDRVETLAQFVSRGPGIISTPTAQTILRLPKLALVSRALGSMVRMDDLRRVRIYGSTAYAWGTTARFARDYPDAKPGARRFPSMSEVWHPHPEFIHDELTLRGMCGAASLKDFLTEQEVTRQLDGSVRPPDGVVRLVIGGTTWVARVETVKSHQTGKAGGCAQVAKEIEAICLNQAFGRWRTSLGALNTTLVIGSFADGLRIVRRIRKSLERFEDPPKVWFLFVLLTKSDGQPFEDYRELDVFARLGNIHVWSVENDAPNAAPVAPVWSPWF